MVITSPQERLGGALGAGLVAAGLLYVLFVGLIVQLPGIGAARPDLLTFTPPPPPPEVRIETQAKPSRKTEGKAAPPNLVSKATEVAAPIPPLPVPPPPMPAAPKPFEGSQSTQGAAPVAGPGTGAGGIGNGTGSGGAGDGDGDGYGRESPPRFKSGRMRRGDVPDEIWDRIPGEATVGVIYFVNTDGSVSDCRVTRSSGIAQLDGLTCRLIEQRYRYKPSLDEDGQPVRSRVYHNYTWEQPPGYRNER